ncbi:MAG: TIGR00153 family protein [Desulfobacterales bacterium]|nr:TIGR00153 family protein [Desulfobacterales bacterium]
MPIPFLRLFMKSPISEGLLEHAEKVKECIWAFQQAMECYVSKQCLTFEQHRKEVIKLENEADIIKREVRTQITRTLFIPVDKFQLFMYLREQDQVLDAVEDAMDWLSYRNETIIPDTLIKDFLLLFDAVIDPIEELSKMAVEAKLYFKTYSEKHRKVIKEIIDNIRKMEHEADKIEDKIKHKLFNSQVDAISLFHLIRLVEVIGTIADHSENAADMMRAMLIK